ncbi:hypothetical protein ACQ856_18080 [Mycolicibacterium psychrotolerans]|uniref:hypothetical protein n=1 Tax=Mycolicibacterium psychrotolerans TaxID=216929 RepID=UPI003D67A0DE
MRFTIHTPKTHVAEWDVAGLPSEAPDSLVLAALDPDTKPDGVRAKRLSATTIDAGPAFVFARGVDDLELAGQRIRAAREVELQALEAGQAVALAMLDAGTASERQVAAALGVDRNTVRSWRGKAR